MASAKKGQSATKIALEVGAGVVAAAAAAGAGYYFYGDKSAKKHRAAASKWAKGLKADVIKEAKKVKKLDQKAMTAIVDSAAAMYATARSVDKADLVAATKELKKNWKMIESELGGAKKKAVAKVKKTVASAKKTAKKVVKKVSPKKAAPKKAAKRSR